jgi:hypothetical protein
MEVDDEDRTLLFSGSTRSMLPPRPQSPVPMPAIAKARTPEVNMRGMVRGASERPPSPQSLRGGERPAGPESLRGAVRRPADPEDRTILRPTSTLPPQLQRTAPAPKPPSARPPAMMPTPYMPMKPGVDALSAGPRPGRVADLAGKPAGTAHAPPPVNAPGGTDARRPSDPDPPSSVITARTRIVRARANASWAIGLMAIGAIVGLATAVVAHGDADAVIDAAAGFVEPAHAAGHANGAAAQAAVLPSFVETGRRAVPAGTDQNPAPGACLDPAAAPVTANVSAPIVVNPPPLVRAPETRTASLAGADPSAAAHAAPPKPAPIAYAAPPRIVAPAPAPRPAAAPHEGSTSGGWLANVSPAGAGAPIARPSRAASAPAPKPGGDFETAAAADALAKAQLEASLR